MFWGIKGFKGILVVVVRKEKIERVTNKKKDK